MTMQAERPPRDPEPAATRPRSSREAPARRISPSQAVATRPLLVLLPIILLVVPSIALSLAREPVYSAEARLLVGGFNVEAQAVPGFVEASRSLAETYGRLVSTRAIAERVADILDEEPEGVSGHIEATSIPESSIIRVQGNGASASEAVRYAAAAAAALQDYAEATAAGQTAEQILDEYSTAANAFNLAEARFEALTAAYEARVAASVATEADLEALAAAKANVDRAQLEVETLSERYRDHSGSRGASYIDLVGPASPTGDDSRSALQLAIAGPLLLGSIAGVALVTLVANRRDPRGPAHAARP